MTKRAVIGYQNFYKLCNWLRSRSKDGKISEWQVNLASDELGFAVSAGTIHDAAIAAEIKIDRPKTVAKRTGDKLPSNRMVYLARVVRDALSEIETAVGGAVFSAGLREKLNMLCTDQGLSRCGIAETDGGK